MLKIIPMVLGIVSTNSYLIGDDDSKKAVVVDPADAPEKIAAAAAEQGWLLTEAWITHAHFDHIFGIPGLVKLIPDIKIRLHKEDQPLYAEKGGSKWFSLPQADYPPVTDWTANGDVLQVGTAAFQVRHAPGHSPGHVMFYCAEENVLLAGDVIFLNSIGRTDLPGGDHQTLINSIHSKVFTLPEDSTILSGHGAETTVGREKRSNPFAAVGL